ncbi:hypothetical protein BSM4216_3771 [Bacillus smithii]|nr:hypothetical protein BSM4216_3771 [Bacillus smithii]
MRPCHKANRYHACPTVAIIGFQQDFTAVEICLLLQFLTR